MPVQVCANRLTRQAKRIERKKAARVHLVCKGRKDGVHGHIIVSITRVVIPVRITRYRKHHRESKDSGTPFPIIGPERVRVLLLTLIF